VVREVTFSYTKEKGGWVVGVFPSSPKGGGWCLLISRKGRRKRGVVCYLLA